MERVTRLREEIDRVQIEAQQAEREGDLARAAQLKYSTLLELQRDLKSAEEALQADVRLASVPARSTGRWRAPDRSTDRLGFSNRLIRRVEATDRVRSRWRVPDMLIDIWRWQAGW
jgi:hypothetical protein